MLSYISNSNQIGKTGFSDTASGGFGAADQNVLYFLDDPYKQIKQVQKRYNIVKQLFYLTCSPTFEI